MARYLLSCAGLAAGVTVALAAADLAWVDAPAPAATVVARLAVGDLGVELPLPESPVPLGEAAFAAEPSSGPAFGSSAEPPAMGIAAVPPMAAVPPPAAAPPVAVEPAPDLRPTNEPVPARILARREIEGRDTSLSRVAILPPPRPAFIELRPASTIAELGSTVPVAPWSELASLAVPSWPGTTAGTGSADEPAGPRSLGRTLQSGLASWYGPGFHGRRTASGEVFNQHALTAAHRTLPFGTKVVVVDQKTGRSVTVRINDRGPFGHGRVIDLSRASAQALGMPGMTRVKIVAVQ